MALEASTCQLNDVSTYVHRYRAEEYCDTGSLFQCRKNQTCYQVEEGNTRGVCQCPLGYSRRDDDGCYLPFVPTPEPNKAAPSSHDPSTSSSGVGLAVWLLVPCLIVAVIGVLILAAQRYMWMDRLYQMRVRHYNNVLVGSQGDEDDPPIA